MAPLWRCWDLTAKLRWSEVIFFPPRILRNTKIGHSSSRIGWDPRDLDGFLGLGKFHFFPPKKKKRTRIFFWEHKKTAWSRLEKLLGVSFFSDMFFCSVWIFYHALWVGERKIKQFWWRSICLPPQKDEHDDGTTNMTMEHDHFQQGIHRLIHGLVFQPVMSL